MNKKHTLTFTLAVTFDMLKTFGGLFKMHKLTLREVIDEGGEGVKTFVLQPNHRIRFTAGQYGIWFVPRLVIGKPARLFTISASPTEDMLRITTHISDSPYKKKLASLPIGSSLYMIGALGVFTLGKNPPREAVLVAGGIGATPMRAIAKNVQDSGLHTKLTLVHVSQELYIFQNEFRKLIEDCRFIHRDDLATELEKVAAITTEETPFYLSGPPAFVLQAEKILVKNNRKNIVKDGFLGY